MLCTLKWKNLQILKIPVIDACPDAGGVLKLGFAFSETV